MLNESRFFRYAVALFLSFILFTKHDNSVMSNDFMGDDEAARQAIAPMQDLVAGQLPKVGEAFATGGQDTAIDHIIIINELVAENKADSYLAAESRLHYSLKEIGADKLPAESPLRHVLSGERVELYFFKVQPDAAYSLELSLLADTSRTLNIISKNHLLQQVQLIGGEARQVRLKVPSELYQDGTLYAEVRRIGNGDAVLSGARLLSDRPHTDPIASQPDRPTPVEMPARLTPLARSVYGVERTSMSLNGVWQFNPSPPEEFWKSGQLEENWKPINVPGSWFMQGFVVEPDSAAGYLHSFTLPADWQGQRVKLRCDGIYSDAQLWINGHPVGGHLGGFTAFEFDMTPWIKWSEPNQLAISVRSTGKTDTLTNGINYAEHDIGGIIRNVGLLVVPPVHITEFDVETDFDASYRDAVLALDFGITNLGEQTAEALGLKLELVDPNGIPVELRNSDSARLDVMPLEALPANGARPVRLQLPIDAPAQWNSENPNLYRLTATLTQNGEALQTTTRRVGFREIEVQGNTFLINGQPTTLRGVSHHEIYPTLGRSVPEGIGRRDVELLRAANINLLRTVHYPPTQEFLEAADELGMFVECEAPFCWAEGTVVDAHEIPRFFTIPTLEMVREHRNHPSIVIWSLSNESHRWRDYFKWTAQAVREEDPTRPRTFSGAGLIFWDEEEMEIATPHYPGLEGPRVYSNAGRPTFFDECMHLNCYNREELVTDPGLRDVWGQGITEMWERCYSAPGIVGTSIWSGIDEIFYAPGDRTLGLGGWGLLDGWRRTKPEYWHAKKAYSPLRLDVANRLAPAAAQGTLNIHVQNRFNFTNLEDVRFDWKISAADGMSLANGRGQASGAPHTTGSLQLRLPEGPAAAGSQLELTATDARGMLLDIWTFLIEDGDGSTRHPAPDRASHARASIEANEETISVRCGDQVWRVDAHSGQLRQLQGAQGTFELSGPELMVLPLAPPPPSSHLRGTASYDALTSTCLAWNAEQVTHRTLPDGYVEIEVKGSYVEAQGTYLLRFGPNGLTVHYDFALHNTIDPRQIGLVFTLPRSYDTLSWQREGQWSYYPEDHIGRLSGKVRPFPHGINVEGLETPRTLPDWSWAEDANALGSNDFRSTRMYIRRVCLQQEDGLGIAATSNATQHARAWIEGETVRLLIADYSNEGSAGFFIEHVIPNRPLKPGDRVSGEVNLEPLIVNKESVH